MIKIHKSKKNGQYWFTVHARNGKVLVTSETYKKLAGCENGVQSLQNVFQQLNPQVDIESQIKYIGFTPKKK